MTKTRMQYIFLILTFILIFAFQKINFISVKETINLFLSSIMPSLFLFILFTNILLRTNISKPLKKLFGKNASIIYTALIGFFCGYPMGAKTTSSMIEKNKITNNQALFLMSFANNANPIFILSTIGIATLDNIYYGIVLLISHYLSSLIICVKNIFSMNIIHENTLKLNTNSTNMNKNINNTPFKILNDSIKSTYITLSQILAFLILFNIIGNFIILLLTRLNINSKIIYTLYSMLESTMGIKLIYLNVESNLITKLILISFALGFSGLSIIFQIYSCIYKYNISLWYIINNKLKQGIISSIITYVLITINKNNTLNFNINFKKVNETTYYLIAVTLLFLISATIKKVTRKKS